MNRFYTIVLTSLFSLGLFASNSFKDNSLKETFKAENSFKIDSVALENEFVKVMQNSAACIDKNTPNFGSRVIVALSNTNIESSKGTIALRRGGVAVFMANESYKSPYGEYFEVAFKINHPPLKKPEEWIEPLKNSIVYEDEQFRVFEERLAPGDTRELHSHAQRVVVRLNNVKLTDPRTKPNGSSGSGGVQVPNTVKFAEPIVHVVKNLSMDTELFNIVIEFKLPKN
jgi:hypothetical protein